MYKVKKNGYNFISLMLFLFIVILVFNFGAIVKKLKPSLSFGNIKANEILKLKKDNFENTKSIFLLKNGFIRLEDSKIYYYENNNIVWSKEINGKNIDIYTGTEYIYIINLELGDVFKIDYKGNIKNQIYSLGKIKEIISVLDKHLILVNDVNEIMKFDSELILVEHKSVGLENILNIAYYNDFIYILNLESKGSLYFTRMMKISEDLKILSNRNFNNEIYYNVFFDSNGNVILGSYNKIIKIDEEYEIIWEKTFDSNIENIKVDNKIYLNLVNKMSNEIQVIDENGVILLSEIMPIEEILDIKITNENILLFNRDNICILDSNLEIIFLKEMSGEIEGINLINNTNLYIDTENEFYVLELEM